MSDESVAVRVCRNGQQIGVVQVDRRYIPYPNSTYTVTGREFPGGVSLYHVPIRRVRHNNWHDEFVLDVSDLSSGDIESISGIRWTNSSFKYERDAA